MSRQIPFDFLKKIDFNSALYFSAFMGCRTIYTTSVVMNCSPATVSIMIKRFCSYFSEPLLERKGRVLTPTTYAIELNKIIMEMISNFHFNINYKCT
jgi:DNA-binding transcriptional LysR family regulator